MKLVTPGYKASGLSTTGTPGWLKTTKLLETPEVYGKMTVHAWIDIY